MAYRRSVRCPAGMPRDLVPLPGEAWLQEQSLVPVLYGVILGALGLILATLMLPVTTPQTVGLTMVLLSGLGVLGILYALLLLVLEWVLGTTRQYCPECLCFMSRGARVCPYCHFRPLPPQEPASASSKA